MNIFYVYTHARPDTGALFYVGKGHGKRVNQSNAGRNQHWRNVVRKAGGFSVEYIAQGLDEELALLTEVEAIDAFRRRGAKLVNVTSGGEGVSGLRHSDATRAVIREKRKSQRVAHSPETKAKIGRANSVALLGVKRPDHAERMRGRKQSAEHVAKRVAHLLGKPRPAEVVEKVAAANKGQKRSDEARRKMSEAHMGKSLPPEVRAKMSESQKQRWAKSREAKNANDH